MTNQQGVPEALRLADALYDGSYLLSEERYNTADELRRLHAYCQELEAQVIVDCMTHGTGAQVEALSAAQAGVPTGLVIADIGFRWDSEKLQHVPKLVIEFEPVPVNSPCDAKGWKDRDAIAAALATAQHPSPSPAPADQMAAFSKTMLEIYGNEFPDQGEFAGDHGWSDHWAIFRAGVAHAALPAPAQPVHVQNSPENEHIADDVSKNGQELNTTAQPGQEGEFLNKALALIGTMVSQLREHRWCGDCYPESGWPGVMKALAGYEAFKRAAPQPATADVVDALSNEQWRAIRDAYESAGTESYFEARPQIDCIDRRRVFTAGFGRGWDAALAAQREVKP